MKTLLSYVSRGKLSGFEEAMKRVIDFEDLLRLLLPSENRGGAAGAGGLSDLQKWKGELKDNLQEDIQFSVQCRCHFHRELEETQVFSPFFRVCGIAASTTMTLPLLPLYPTRPRRKMTPNPA